MGVSALHEGDILYHGTSVEDPFEDDDETPDGPAWFSEAVAIADYFKTWHEGPNPRILIYRVTREPNLWVWMGDDDIEDLLGEDAIWDGYETEDVIDAVEREGYDGWTIPFNYPEGADIMLLAPEDHLELVEE